MTNTGSALIYFFVPVTIGLVILLKRLWQKKGSFKTSIPAVKRPKIITSVVEYTRSFNWQKLLLLVILIGMTTLVLPFFLYFALLAMAILALFAIILHLK